MKIRSEALEPSHRLWIPFWAHCDIVSAIAHIDSRGERMTTSKPGFSDCSRRASSFLALRFRHRFLSVLIPVLLDGN
jgi:hypothetical protein